MSTYARGREKNIPIDKLECPICNKPQRSEGWLRWHINKVHPEYEYVKSPADARGLNKHDAAMARRGFDRCPYIGIYCPGPLGVKPVNCQGKAFCVMLEYHPYLEKAFGG